MAGRTQNQTEESTPAAATTTDISILEKSHGVSVEQKAGPESDTDTKRSATDDEVANLAQTADSLPLAVIIVMIIGGAERFAYYALSGPWQNYIQNPPGDYALPGALGLGQATATAINNAYRFLSFLTPLIVGVLSDTWLGRYKALLWSMIVYACGGLILLLTSLPIALDHGAGPAGLGVSMILIACGVGGVNKIQLFRAHLGIRNQIHNYLYTVSYFQLTRVTNLSSLSIIPATFLESKFGFWSAYLLGFGALLISIAILCGLSSKLVKVPKGTNIILSAGKVLGCAIKSGFRLDNTKASYQASHYNRAVSWTDEFVDEIKVTLRTCRVLLSMAVFTLCMGQMLNNLVSQAGQMELHGVPNDMIQALSGIAVVLLGPAIQGVMSLLAKRRILLGPIVRMAISFIFTAAGMAFAGGVQQLIYSAPPCYNAPLACAESMGGTIPNNINVWMQTPIHFILASGEILGYVAMDEVSYTNSPQGLKSVVQAFKQLSNCLGSILGLALSPVSRDPYLVVLYSSLAGVMVLITGIFWYYFGKYDRPKRAQESPLDTTEESEAKE
ncbi:unnamed protein product [Clonostachys chloroleuca]|uniref:Uncharacterized protein n=1 Tax=Clonostachys chloroleuca TaxID=1926264 RepID=A0AA35PZN1_9HYPO|nr:unnamed protein product [Clonostachys chloroleuca]